MRKLMFCLFALVSAAVYSAEEETETYEFAGKHFLASYLDCDPEALKDLDTFIANMDKAVEASGASILDRTEYRFSPEAVTVVYLLSESHASVHTYPEHNACFIDLFTCGDHCSSEKFDELLRAYLKPKEVDARLFLRGHTTKEVPLSR